MKGLEFQYRRKYQKYNDIFSRSTNQEFPLIFQKYKFKYLF
jgi:hypothetical protein